MFVGHFHPPFRVGRKQQRVVLDNRGYEVVQFPTGLEQMAQEYCDILNIHTQLNNGDYIGFDFIKWLNHGKDGPRIYEIYDKLDVLARVVNRISIIIDNNPQIKKS